MVFQARNDAPPRSKNKDLLQHKSLKQLEHTGTDLHLQPAKRHPTNQWQSGDCLRFRTATCASLLETALCSAIMFNEFNVPLKLRPKSVPAQTKVTSISGANLG
jgi:hypothetical protein